MIDAVLLTTGIFLHNADTGSLIASLLLLAYIGVSVAAQPHSILVRRGKPALMIAIILATVSHATISLIAKRQATAPHLFVHDHPMQMEAAVSFLLGGKNPYAVSYRETPMKQWAPEHSAFEHVIALPFTILKSVPFYVIWQKLFGWYDERISQLFLLWLGIGALWLLFRTNENRLAAIALFAFNPLFTPFFIEGRSDVVFLSLLICSLAALRRERPQWALLLLALSATSKHMAWFAVPFILTYLTTTGYLGKRDTIRKLLPSLLLVLSIILPFALWDWKAFLDDIYSFPAGTLPTSWPIAGVGLSMSLHKMGILKDVHGPFPSGILQLFLLPLLAYLILDLKRRPGMGRAVLYYGFFLWPFLYLSRFLYSNYLGAIITILSLGLLLMHEEKEEESAKMTELAVHK